MANGLARRGGPLGRAAYVWGKVFPPEDAMALPGSFWEARQWLPPLRYAHRIASYLATKRVAMLKELALALGAGDPEGAAARR